MSWLRRPVPPPPLTEGRHVAAEQRIDRAVDRLESAVTRLEEELARRDEREQGQEA